MSKLNCCKPIVFIFGCRAHLLVSFFWQVNRSIDCCELFLKPRAIGVFLVPVLKKQIINRLSRGDDVTTTERGILTEQFVANDKQRYKVGMYQVELISSLRRCLSMGTTNVVDRHLTSPSNLTTKHQNSAWPNSACLYWASSVG